MNEFVGQKLQLEPHSRHTGATSGQTGTRIKKRANRNNGQITGVSMVQSDLNPHSEWRKGMAEIAKEQMAKKIKARMELKRRFLREFGIREGTSGGVPKKNGKPYMQHPKVRAGSPGSPSAFLTPAPKRMHTSQRG